MPAFPVTVDANAQMCEAPAYCGPFVVGTDLYLFNSFSDGLGGVFVIALKSSDTGNTWTEIDPVNHPPSGGPYTAVQSSGTPTTMYVIFTDPNTGMVTVQIFDALAQAWGAVLGAAFIGGFQTAVYRPSDNSIVVFSNGADSTPNGAHAIVSFAVFDIGAGTFGAPIDLGFLDFADPTLWDMQTAGAVLRSDGKISVFLQQPTRSTPQPAAPVILDFTPGSSSPFQIPFDCPVIDLVECYGGGGGAQGGGGADNGGGGGGGYRSTANLAVTPLANVPFLVGAGGPRGVGVAGSDGGDTSFNGGTLATGGKGGNSTVGGAGGAGSNAGGKGGDGSGAAAGGGGGCGGPTSPGGPGVDSDGTHGGAGGVGGGGQAGGGGEGGQVLLGIRFNGGPGGPVGGAGGGASSDGGLNIGQGGDGADGALRLTYTPFTNSHPSRVFQQTINADNSLGALTEITEAGFPIDGGYPMVPFDCKAGNGFVAICFTRVTASGVTNIIVGKADNAAVLAFAFQTIAVGNGAAGIDPEPALAIKPSGDMLLAYISAADLVNVNFRFRLDTGSGFGSEKAIGTFADAGARLQCAFAFDKLLGTFGTPTLALVQYVGAS